MTDPAVEPAQVANTYPDAHLLGDLLPAWLERAPDAPALSQPERPTWSRQQLALQVGGVQAALGRMGVEPGDKVALLCDNSLEMVASLLGIVAMGAVAVPVNTGLVGNGLRYVLQHSDSRALILDPSRASQVRKAGIAPDVFPVIGTGGASDGQLAWDIHVKETDSLPVVGAPSDPAMILYSSGTTGFPKGVVLNHATCLIASRACASIEFEATSDDVLFTSLPLFHCAAQQMLLWTSGFSGAHLVVAPKFSASRFWPIVEQYSVSAFHFIGPLMTVLWNREPTPRDAQHGARLAVGGGPRKVWTEFEDRFGVDIVESYGMTEAFGGCVTHRPRRGKAWTVGKPIDSVEVAVVDESGHPVPDTEHGEIVIRPVTPHAMFSEYYKDPERTAQAWRDGWYLTGDQGSFDEDGYLRFHARLRDVIRRRGENISAVEVEETIVGMDGVEEAAAVAVPSELGEDEVFAVVVAEPDRELTCEAIWDYLDGRIAAFAIPKYIRIVSELPKTATLRIKKHELGALLDGAADRANRE